MYIKIYIQLQSTPFQIEDFETTITREQHLGEVRQGMSINQI